MFAGVDDYCTRWKFAPFQVRTNLESVSGRLQPGIRFLHPPIPAPPSDPLAIFLPYRSCDRTAKGRAYHVPHDIDATGCVATGCLGSISPPVVFTTTYPQNRQGYPTTYRFGLGAMLQAAFAYLYLRGFKR